MIALVDRAEYKRRQQPPGVKITPRAFGRDRRMPITNAYRLASAPVKHVVIRTSAHRRPSSSVMSTSHTAVVRPRWRRRAVAWIVPPVIGRRKLVWLEIDAAVAGVEARRRSPRRRRRAPGPAAACARR